MKGCTFRNWNDKMPDFEFENQYDIPVAGIDEAGRGPWAGPVVAGAVIIVDKKLNDFLLGVLNDSKKLTPKKREALYESLFAAQEAGQLFIGIGEASAEEIDRYNILQATFLAMQRAVVALKLKPQFALGDGNQTPKNLPCPCRTVIKGDARSYSIAAASIVAKVYRDRLMVKLAEKYPYYGFEKNAGYGTAAHIAGLKSYGIIEGQHRKSYRPIQEVLRQRAG